MRLPSDLRNTPSDAAMEAAIEDTIDNAIDGADVFGTWPARVIALVPGCWTDAAIRRVLKRYVDSGWQVTLGVMPPVICLIGRPGDKMPAVPFIGAPKL